MPELSMKKARLFFFLLTLMLSFCTGEFAFAGAFSMGQLQAFSSDGSLDVVRNPSIMTAQRETNSIGFILLSTPYYLRRYSYDSYLNTWINDARVHDTKYITGSVYLSYCRKVGKGAIGIAVDTDNPYQGLYAEYERSVAGVMTGSIYYELVRGDFMKVSPRFVFSFGSVVAGNHSIGVQIAAGYTRKKDDYGFISSTNSAFLAKNHDSMRMEGASAELVVGYSYRDPDSQIGLMIRSGRFSWQKTRIYYTMADFSATLFFAGTVSEPFAMH